MRDGSGTGLNESLIFFTGLARMRERNLRYHAAGYGCGMGRETTNGKTNSGKFRFDYKGIF